MYTDLVFYIKYFRFFDKNAVGSHLLEIQNVIVMIDYNKYLYYFVIN